LHNKLYTRDTAVRVYCACYVLQLCVR